MSNKQHERTASDNNDNLANGGKSTPAAIPDLSKSEHEKVESPIALNALVVHETVREEGLGELELSSLALPGLDWRLDSQWAFHW